MKGTILSLAAGGLALSAISALAMEPAKHTVAWYRPHQQARQSVLATCQNDHTFDESGDCRNAQSASHGALADSLGNSGQTDPEATVAYYGKNGGLIAMVLNMCSRPGAARAPESWCQAASTALANLHH